MSADGDEHARLVKDTDGSFLGLLSEIRPSVCTNRSALESIDRRRFIVVVVTVLHLRLAADRIARFGGDISRPLQQLSKRQQAGKIPYLVSSAADFVGELVHDRPLNVHRCFSCSFIETLDGYPLPGTVVDGSFHPAQRLVSVHRNEHRVLEIFFIS